MSLFSGFSIIWVHYKTLCIHWSENKDIIDFYAETNPFFLFFVTSWHFLKTHDFINYFSISTNQIAKCWDQLPWHCHWNHTMINTLSSIWHAVEQWVNLKWNAVTMKKGIKSPYMTFSQKNTFSRANSFLFTLIHTTPAHAENKWRLVLYDFSWNTMSVA